MEWQTLHLVIDYNRYVISKLCSDSLDKGKGIYRRNAVWCTNGMMLSEQNKVNRENMSQG